MSDIAIFYGLEGNTPAIFDTYRATGRKAVYIDLGYWGRREGGRWFGYHKLVVNNRHPTGYLMAQEMPADRFTRFGIPLEPARTEGKHILLAGMGDKGAIAEGFQPEQWERDMIAHLRMYTDRPIHYRPKPSWKGAMPIDGTKYSHPKTDIREALHRCWAVVTHHSNVAVDALVAGVPVFCEAGVAQLLSADHICDIEKFTLPEGRQQWVNNLAYQQWSIDEMRTGAAWASMRDRRIV